MSDTRQLISMPAGGGAVRGLGERFIPDLHTGTGNFSVPLSVPAGRAGLAPQLDLLYSTGVGNGPWGLGWSLSVPGVSRKTSHGVPRYDDQRDTFVLSGVEDLVPVDRGDPTRVRYRPRTDGLFARIVHHRDPALGTDYWEVTAKSGLVSRYGTTSRSGVDAVDPATLTDPSDSAHVFAWRLTETRDPLGNVILYDYIEDRGNAVGHHWRQPLLRRIRYVDHETNTGEIQFLANISLDYETRADPFSDYRAGFEIRTTQRCRAITTTAQLVYEQPVRRYDISYRQDPRNGVSLLASVQLVGFDDDGAEHRDLPPLEFDYTVPERESRSFSPVSGPQPPSAPLAGGDLELVDVTGDGLPDVLEVNATTARYWRNVGGRTFQAPRPMRNAPAGLDLSNPGVQLLDTDGDGRVDLLVTSPTTAGRYPIRADGAWGAYQPYATVPTFDLEDPEVRLIDLTGDGVTDILRVGAGVEYWLNDRELGWIHRRSRPASLGDLSFADPRVKLADMTGDGLLDIVFVTSATVDYWPNVAHGRWKERIRTTRAPQLPPDYDPRRVLLGDVDGDGVADLIYVDVGTTTVWFNQSGNSWSAPVVIRGTPTAGPGDNLRLADLLGNGTGGVVYSRDPTHVQQSSMYFLDLVGPSKPRLLSRIRNNLGATTTIEYSPSTLYARADAEHPATEWRTTLPIVVSLVARVTVSDAVSRSKLVTEYGYHHGYWDGHDKEFRGFGRVEQADTQAFESYNTLDHPGETAPIPVERESFSPPTLTRTWFHLGPVTDAKGDWTELDYRAEYWGPDANLLADAGSTGSTPEVSDSRSSGSREVRRGALRAMRGRVLRSEMYAEDASSREDRPYTVNEHDFVVHAEETPRDTGHPPVFVVLPSASRTTEWERGEDPMTRFTFTGDYDGSGQPRRTTTIAPPRRSMSRQPLAGAVVGVINPDETQILATHTRTTYAKAADEVHIHDRVAQTTTYELLEPAEVIESAPEDLRAVLRDQAAAALSSVAAFDRLDPSEVQVIEHEVNHYDGEPFTGLASGLVGSHGLLSRAASLVFSDELLTTGYGSERRGLLNGTGSLPAGTPANTDPSLGFHHNPQEPGYLPGWYADTVQCSYDVQLDDGQGRGVLRATRDALGNQTTIAPDRFWFLPAVIEDPLGLVTTATYDYRLQLPRSVVDPNGTTTRFTYHPLGLLASTYLQGSSGDGGRADQPEVRYDYDFMAFVEHGQPVNVHTTARIWHLSDGVSDETIQTREYSDGFGRLVQRRTQADVETLNDDASLLVSVPGDESQPRPRASGGAVALRSDPDRVVVSGWQVFDNKGRVVLEYEPHYGSGWNFQSARDQPGAKRIRRSYDPRGQLIRTTYPDDSETQVLLGWTPDPASPDDFQPTPWATTEYDANDLAARTSSGNYVPVQHHYTPTMTVLDALGRPRCQLVHGGGDPTVVGHLTRSHYDMRGNLLELIDEHGRTAHSYAYDLLNTQIHVGGIDAGNRTLYRDAARNLVLTEDARGCQTMRTYDAANRPVAVRARDTAQAPLTLRERITYGDEDPDPASALTDHRLGRLWRHLDEAGERLVETYDFRGRPTEEVRAVVSDAAIAAADPLPWTADWTRTGAQEDLDPTEHRTSTRYDALGRPTRIVVPADEAGHRQEVAATYGRSGSLATLAVDDAPFVEFLAHNARGQRTFIGYGNGLITRYGYEPRTFRLTRLRTESARRTPEGWTPQGPPLQDLTYTHDLVGNLTGIEEQVPGCGVAGSAAGRNRLIRNFGYDAFYRLRTANGRTCADLGDADMNPATPCGWFPAAPSQANAAELTVGYLESYDYDAVGNLIGIMHRQGTGQGAIQWRRSFGLADLPPEEATHARSNRMTTLSHGSAPQQRARYDEAGNMVSLDETRTYAWDHAGRLVGFRISAGAGTSVSSRYLYGADGHRVKKWTRRNDSPTLEESTTYVATLWELQRWTTDGGGAATVVHLLDGERRIARVRSGTARHPRDSSPDVVYDLVDHLGSSSVTVDATGTWVNREEYFPYGETSFGSYSRKRYRFAGVEQDEESGLIQLGARYYHAPSGRWISPDPGGPMDGLSGYVAFRDSPLTYRDPQGLQSQSTSTSGADRVSGVCLDYQQVSPDDPRLKAAAPDMTIKDFLRSQMAPLNVPKTRGPSMQADTRTPAELRAARLNFEGYENFLRDYPGLSYDMYRLYSSAKAHAASDPVRFVSNFGTAKNRPGYREAASSSNVWGAPTHMKQPTSGSATIRNYNMPVELGSKLQFLFGKATGSEHNVQRTNQMLDLMNRIGVPDTGQNRAAMAEHFRGAFNAGGMFQGKGTLAEQSRTVHESLLVGPQGTALIQSVWEQNRLITFTLHEVSLPHLPPDQSHLHRFTP